MEQLNREYSTIETPDLKDNIKQAYLDSLDQQEYKRKTSIFPKLMIGISSFVAATILLVVLLKPNPGLPINGGISVLVNDNEKATAFEAITSLDMMATLDSSKSSPLSRKMKSSNHQQTASELNDILKIVNKGLNSEGIEVVNNDYPFDNYQKETVITIKDDLGNNIDTYTMLYNIEKEIEDDETEEEWMGIIKYQDLVYNFSLESEQETENGDSEQEMEFHLRDQNSTKEIIVEKEIENNEIEFTYFIKDGTDVEIISMEVEKEKYGTSIILTKNNNTYRCSLKTDENNISYIYVNISSNEYIKIYQKETGLEYYFYENNELVETITL